MSAESTDPSMRRNRSPAASSFDARLEERLGAVLRVGVWASSICLGAGLLLALAGVLPAAAMPLLTIGLIILMATPIARVAVSVVVYASQRDWVFALLTGIVLAELCASIFAALVFHRRL